MFKRSDGRCVARSLALAGVLTGGLTAIGGCGSDFHAPSSGDSSQSDRSALLATRRPFRACSTTMVAQVQEGQNLHYPPLLDGPHIVGRRRSCRFRQLHAPSTDWIQRMCAVVCIVRGGEVGSAWIRSKCCTPPRRCHHAKQALLCGYRARGSVSLSRGRAHGCACERAREYASFAATELASGRLPMVTSVTNDARQGLGWNGVFPDYFQKDKWAARLQTNRNALVGKLDPDNWDIGNFKGRAQKYFTETYGDVDPTRTARASRTTSRSASGRAMPPASSGRAS
jgi:hypothetical protein